MVFIHIPKCAGTAFENYVLSQGSLAAHSRAFTGLGVDGLPETVAKYFELEVRSPFLFGHFSYRDIQDCCPPALRCTFLRDPLARTISHYKSWHDPRNFQPGDPHYAAASPELRVAMDLAHGASFEEFVCSENPVIRAGALGNQQTLYLSSYEGEDMEGHLASAMENLAATEFFGITEAFAQSIELLRRRFPGFAPYALGADGENRSVVGAGVITQRSKDIVESQVAYDRRLYRYAVELFRARLREQSLAAENEQLRLRTGLLEQEIKRMEARGSAESASPTGAADERNAEIRFLRSQVTHLQASYDELRQVYEQITQSRSWRLAAALQTYWMRLLRR